MRSAALFSIVLAALGCNRELNVLYGPDAGSPPGAQYAIAGGFEHTCAIRGGQLYCWGINFAGQVGDGTTDARALPVRVGTFEDWVEIGAGEAHTCGLRVDGSLYCWGSNSSGQLGLGDFSDRHEPTLVDRGPWLAIQVGDVVTCGLDSLRRLHCFGENWEGQIAQGDFADSPDIPVPASITPFRTYTSFCAGQGHACAIDETGALYCWGRNTDGELGLGEGAMGQYREPMLVSAIDDATQIACAQHHSCALRADGSIYCWGRDTHGEVGQGLAIGDDQVFRVPTRVGMSNEWRSIEAEWFHVCAQDASGQLYCFGRNIEGQIGDADQARASVGLPAPVVGEFGFVQFVVGRFHTCALTGTDVIACWGKNTNGQLGIGDTLNRWAPVRVEL